METAQPFQARVVGALNAHFKQPAGPSRAGTDWKVLLTGPDGERQVFVRTYADDVGRLSQDQQAQAVLEYIGELSESGWSPDQYRGESGELTVVRGPATATGNAAGDSTKPWWRFW